MHRFFALYLLCCNAILLFGQQAGFAAPIVVKDDLGRTINLPHAPLRIVSLEPSVTEELFAVGAGNKLVADDLYSDYPKAAQQLPHVNGIGPSQEMLYGLHPDLIVLFDQTFTVEKADEWVNKYGAPILVLNAGSYGGVEADIQRLGQLVGDSADTLKVVNSMESARRSVAKTVAGLPKPTVFVAVWDHPLMTAGRGTFITSLIELAGGVNVAARNVSGYPTYSPEQLVRDNPDFIFTGTPTQKASRTTLAGLSAYDLRAVGSGNIYAIPDDWTARPGPRLALGLVSIARVLHPMAFNR